MYGCGGCGAIFETQAELRSHMTEDHGTVFPAEEEPETEVRACPHCGHEIDINEEAPQALAECGKCERWFDPWGSVEAIECPSCQDWIVSCPHCHDWTDTETQIKDAIECDGCQVATAVGDWLVPASD